MPNPKIQKRVKSWGKGPAFLGLNSQNSLIYCKPLAIRSAPLHGGLVLETVSFLATKNVRGILMIEASTMLTTHGLELGNINFSQKPPPQSRLRLSGWSNPHMPEAALLLGLL